MRMSGIVLLLVCAMGFCAGSALAQDQSATNSGDRFMWWWEREEGSAPQARPGVPPGQAPAPSIPEQAQPAEPAVTPESVSPVQAAGDKEMLSDAYARLVDANNELRKSIADAERRYRDADGRNLELTNKMRDLEEKEASLARTLADLNNSGAMTVEAAQKAAAISNELDAIRGENVTLKQRIGNLTAELEKKQAQMVAVTSKSGMTEDSDLYRRLSEENALLRKNLMDMKDAEKRAATAQQTLDQKDQEWFQKSESMKAQLSQLEDRNRELKDTLDGYQTKSGDTQRLEAELAQLRNMVDERDQQLDRSKLEMEQIRLQAVEPQSTASVAPVTPEDQVAALAAAAAGGETALSEGPVGAASRDDLYFNLAVLYVKTGMYKQAEKEMLRLARAGDSSPDLQYNLGVLYDTYLGDKKKARKYYRKFLELSPAGADAEKVRLWLLDAEMSL